MSKKKIGDYQIPFDVNGNQKNYAGWPENCTWRSNFEFRDTLTFDQYYKGRSKVGFEMKMVSGTKVSVFLSDFVDMIPHMSKGQIKGIFTFHKNGSNYGCRLVKVENEK